MSPEGDPISIKYNYWATAHIILGFGKWQDVGFQGFIGTVIGGSTKTYIISLS